MLGERFLKVIPSMVFLFCILEIFELALIIDNMNQTEKLEKDLRSNLQTIETIMELLNEHLNGMDSEHFQNKKLEISNAAFFSFKF
ncbi:hypothetical protein [Helicobacter pylori]|uniref:hypothetical protein n=1 Tax=Helicobacter pylori TaxID=210 RepID=UPI0009A341B7|nr:hypothetical protein [Helicobacter pylori]OPG48078.1 hypothetical protein BGL72_06280 [Helicobacter pylori]